jgi:hypothetical protein
MPRSLSNIRWFRVLGAAAAVVAVSFLVLMVIITVYAFTLAFHVRGAPDQKAINHCAATVSRTLMPWLEMLLTLAAAFIVARKAETAAIVHGLLIGVFAAVLSVAVKLAFGGHLGWRSLVSFLAVTGLGWLGGFLGQKWTGRT